MRAERITFDFAPAARRAQPLGVALAGLGALAMVFGGLVWGEAWSAQKSQSDALAAIRSQEAEAATQSGRITPPTASEVARSRATLRVAHGLQTPWSDLLNALESAPHDNVALLAIEPSLQKQTVRLTAEARQPEAMLDYLAALQSDARISHLTLVSHQVQTQAPGKPVRFQLQAVWGAAP